MFELFTLYTTPYLPQDDKFGRIILLHAMWKII